MKKIVDEAFLSMLEARDLQIGKPMNGLFGGNRRSKEYGSSAEFADFRDYIPGDDLRRIDWNLYARFEKLYLKLFVDERQLHHRIYLDASASIDWGRPSKGEMMLKLTAALSFLSVQAMDRVSVSVIHKDSCEEVCRAITGREAFYGLAEKLNDVKFFGDGNMEKAIQRNEDLGKDDGLTILISDFFTDCDWKSAVDELCFRGRRVYLVQIVSRDEITPGISGKLLLHDAEAVNEDDEKNLRTKISRSAIKAYEEAFLWHQSDIRSFCESRGAGFMTVCSDESIERMLFRQATEAGLVR